MALSVRSSRIRDRRARAIGWSTTGSCTPHTVSAGGRPPPPHPAPVLHTGMPSAEDAIGRSARVQFETFLDEHRSMLAGCLDGVTEDQARRRLVSSGTTLLGLVKHATFVERVWFDEAVTCRS